MAVADACGGQATVGKLIQQQYATVTQCSRNGVIMCNGEIVDLPSKYERAMQAR